MSNKYTTLVIVIGNCDHIINCKDTGGSWKKPPFVLSQATLVNQYHH
jgi:hypothetical protein